jgi:hypothetical protein
MTASPGLYLSPARPLRDHRKPCVPVGHSIGEPSGRLSAGLNDFYPPGQSHHIALSNREPALMASALCVEVFQESEKRNKRLEL